MTSTDVARANIEAFNAGDWEGLAATFADKCVYDELATHRHLEGQEAIVEANRAWKEAFPDAKGRINRAMADNGTVTLELTWEGTQSGPLHMPTGDVAHPVAESTSKPRKCSRLRGSASGRRITTST
jgi:steroid delta-isomerase-like uncharacterized protein